MNTLHPTVHRAGPIPARLDDLQLCQTLQTALGLRYSFRVEQFSFAAPKQTTGTAISEDALIAVIASTLAEQPALFSPGQIRPRRLKRIVATLRGLCADADDDLHRSLESWVDRRLRLQPGSDITSAEIYAAYEADCQHAGEPPMSRWEFQRQLPEVIKHNFGLAHSHEVLRPDPTDRLTPRRGWLGLTITDATDGTLHLALEQTQPSQTL